ncbi:MAG: hypothetical protein H6945_16895 [Zoogloeaceae bacterium]|nr:hypothetical protein [Rhodocyclaceae bacterium]MCP5237418.1 hypothetical protein [Zoogloeaceae bacterium]
MEGQATGAHHRLQDAGRVPRRRVGAIAPATHSGRLSEAEAECIRQAIASTGGNLTEAARQLAIAKSTLYQKLRDYGLQDDVLMHRCRRGQAAR